jgi:hypothetical protein
MVKKSFFDLFLSGQKPVPAPRVPRPSGPQPASEATAEFIVRMGRVRRGEPEPDVEGADKPPPPLDPVAADAAFIINAGKRRRGEIE